MAGGGYVVDRLSRQDRRNRLRIPALFSFCSGLILLTAFQWSPGVLQFILIGAGLMVGACVIGCGGAVVTELVPTTIHATALATLSLAMNLLGSAPGPVVIGWIADRSGLQAALEFLPLPCLVSAVAFALAANYYEADRRSLHG
jgi:MFS family permease